ncbi:MAG: hypothetical protein K2H22_05675, partial [Muribaculaceae bacterium]|nr:hypothetical protein [Muribaculaceae bacterium]
DEEEDISSLARIDDITLTQNLDTDYSEILKGINERNRLTRNNERADFIFPLPNGRIVKRLSDFTSSAAKRDMQQYIQAQEEHSELEKKLTDLRKQYHNSAAKKGASAALKNQILDLEKKREWQSERLKKMRNTIISAETKQ